jgi:hypothetical protein
LIQPLLRFQLSSKEAMYKPPTSPSERIKQKKISNLIEREFLNQEGHDDDPVTFVRITNQALNDPLEAKRKLKLILNRYGVENSSCFVQLRKKNKNYSLDGANDLMSSAPITKRRCSDSDPY